MAPQLKLLVICLWLSSFTDTSSSLECEMVVLRAVKGRDALLPCGQGRVFLDGPNSYVLWLKDNKEFLYRYPNEENTRALSIQAEQPFGSRCEGDSCRDPTSLHLKRVGEHDEGVYRCRVHYQASPAVDYVIDLRIVDSPGKPRIYNADGVDLAGHVGQLSLGANMTLICEIDDEQPGTLLWWERNGVEMERAESVQNGVLKTSIHVHNATRDELDAHYECLAQNADVTDPLSASVVVKMHLPPMSVEIRLNNNLDFEAGLPRVVDCVVVGCVPPPTITWHLGDVMLRPSVHKELHDGNFTVSSLTLAPSLRDDKHELSCRAHNSHLPRELFEDKVILNVGFRPTCLNDHEEVVGYVSGQSEGVTCTVEAYPEPMQFSWTFPDTKTLYTSVKKVPGYQHRYSSSLTWQPQQKDQGELLCRATNVLGEQKRACVYSIVVGGPPMTPDCDLIETYPQNIKIICKKSWDGGRPQTIHLELQNIDGSTLTNITNNYGHFALPQVQEKNVTAVIYASNIRGRSDYKVLTFSPMEPITEMNSTVHAKLPIYAGWIQAIVVIVIVCIILGIIAKFMKIKQRMTGIRSDENAYEEEEPTLTIRSDGSFQRQPDVQPNGQAERPRAHVTIRVPACENQYTLSPMPRFPKAAKLLGFHELPQPGEGDQFPELEQDERQSYFV